jgi:hypothetical protein
MVIAVKRYVRLKAEKADYSARDPAAREAADACLNYVLAALPDIDHLPAAAEALDEADELIRDYESNHLLGKLAEAETRLKKAQRRGQRLTKARLAVEAAEAEGDEVMIKTARVKLAAAVMEFDGDVAAAAELMAQTDDDRAKGMAAAKRFLAGEEVTAEELAEASLVLTQWIKLLEGAARDRAGDVAMKISAAGIAEAGDTMRRWRNCRALTGGCSAGSSYSLTAGSGSATISRTKPMLATGGRATASGKLTMAGCIAAASRTSRRRRRPNTSCGSVPIGRFG